MSEPPVWRLKDTWTYRDSRLIYYYVDGKLFKMYSVEEEEDSGDFPPTFSSV